VDDEETRCFSIFPLCSSTVTEDAGENSILGSDSIQLRGLGYKIVLVAAWKGMPRGPYHEGDIIEEVHWVLL
jgi:hypothetical protein